MPKIFKKWLEKKIEELFIKNLRAYPPMIRHQRLRWIINEHFAEFHLQKNPLRRRNGS